MLRKLKKNVLETLRSQLHLEQKAREEAESSLVEKAAELHKTNEELRHLNQNLELEIADRTQALEASERRYRQIIDTAADLISRTDANGFFTYVNPFAANKYGYEQEEVIGKHCTDFVHPDHKEAVGKFYFNIRRRMQERSYYEFLGVSKSGEEYWIGQNIRLIIEDGRVKEITSVARDITAQVEAEKALRTARMRLSALITNLQSAVLVEDENMCTLLANQHFIDLFGLDASPESMAGECCEKITKKVSSVFAEPEEYVEKTRALTKKREPAIGEEFILKDGTILERDFIPIFVDQKYLGHLWNYRDVTEKRRREDTLRQSEEKYRGIIENMELGLIELDLNHTIVRAYDLFCEMTGYKQQELVGKNATDTFLPFEYAHIFWYSQEKPERSTMVNEVQIRRKDGTLIWALLSGAPIYNEKGNITGSIGIYYDITNRKKLEQDLAEAKNLAEEAQEVEQQFLARMSHEIRTPLNAIIGMSHLLYDTQPTEAQREYLSIVKSSADLLLGIISNILDFSKIRAGEYKLKHRTFDVRGLIVSLQKTFQLKLDESEKAIEVQAYVDPQITNLLIGDDVALNQVLDNLLSNAHKFTNQGVFGIKVEQIKKEGKICHLEFKVYDSGIGIPADQINSIFEDFKQLQNGTNQYIGGTGLGLAIINQFIELQDGQIWVESEEGLGTTFTFRLTYEDSGIACDKATKELMQFEDKVIEGDRILVAEDNLMNRKYVSSLLKKWDLEFIFAHNGREAVELAKEERFSLILMDISMPEMDGFEASISIRNTSSPNQLTPIVALTASALVSTKEKAFRIGMSDFLSKPFKPFQLLELIQKHTKKQDIVQEVNSTFSFNNTLDTTYLDEVYDGDLEYAADIFEIFLTHSVHEIDQLKVHIQDGDWDQTSRLAHKLKPTFAMVGLTGLESKMLQIEKRAGAQERTEQLPEIFQDIEYSLQNNVPKLEADLEKMRTILKVV